MNIESRFADLVAFIEERDRQLTLPFGGDDCGRQSGGRFGQGNTCASEDGAGGSDSDKPSPSSSPAPSGTVSSIQDGAFESGRSLSEINAPGNISSLKVEGSEGIRKLAAKSGLNDLKSLMDICVASADNASVFMTHFPHVRYVTGGRVEVDTIRVTSRVPVDKNDPGKGTVETIVSVEKWGDEEPKVHYNYMQRDGEAQRTIQKEKEANQDTGYSRTEAEIGAAIFGEMLKSLEAARDAGIKTAYTEAAGGPGSDTYQGYRLWGRFGFDGPLDPYAVNALVTEAQLGRGVLSPEHEEKAARTGKLTLQELLSTKQGEKWWAKNGGPINLTIDFSDKESPGYKRFESLLEKVKRAKERGSRSYRDFLDFASRADVCVDLAEWRGFREFELSDRRSSLVEFLESRSVFPPRRK